MTELTQLSLTDTLMESTKEIFETMVFMDIEKCDDPEKKIQNQALLGSITFIGDIEGCLSICCPDTCAKAIAQNMLGLDESEELNEEEISDAIGEISNMVMGSVKARILEFVGNLEVSIPSVVSGRALQTRFGDGINKSELKVTIGQDHIAELSFLYKNATT